MPWPTKRHIDCKPVPETLDCAVSVSILYTRQGRNLNVHFLKPFLRESHVVMVAVELHGAVQEIPAEDCDLAIIRQRDMGATNYIQYR